MSEFQDIPDFPGYKISRKGTVLGKSGNPLRKRLSKNGYHRVCFYKNGKAKHCSVHRLVLKTFVGPPAEGQVCRHLDGNRLNNNLENLAWGTQRENVLDKKVHGTMSLGEKHHKSKLTRRDVVELREMYSAGKSSKEISKHFGISPSVAWTAATGRTWSHVHGIAERTVHHNSKLTLEQAAEIKELYRSGLSQRKLAEVYGVNQGTISHIVTGKSKSYKLKENTPCHH